MFTSVGVENVFIQVQYFELHLRFVNHYNRKREKVGEEGMSWKKLETLYFGRRKCMTFYRGEKYFETGAAKFLFSDYL
jgi:hypothetical protein